MDTNRTDTHVELTPLNMHGHAASWEEELAATVRERDAARIEAGECRSEAIENKVQLLALQRDLEHTNAERLRLRLVLVQIQDWDCLNPPDARLCADHPWLRRLIDNALGDDKPNG
jgi:hypothetical protein